MPRVCRKPAVLLEGAAEAPVPAAAEAPAPVTPTPPAPQSQVKERGVLTSAGRVSEAFASELLRDVLGCLGLKAKADPEVTQRRIRAASDALAAFKAKDELEAMMAAQCTALHFGGMDMLRQAARGDVPADIASRIRRDAARMFCAAAELIGAIERRRGGGTTRQHVVVERVVVHDGGQAVVGAVTSGSAPRVVRENTGAAPHAPRG